MSRLCLVFVWNLEAEEGKEEKRSVDKAWNQIEKSWNSWKLTRCCNDLGHLGTNRTGSMIYKVLTCSTSFSCLCSVYSDDEEWFREIFANSTKDDAIRNQYEFFIQRMGGPSLYSDRKGGQHMENIICKIKETDYGQN